MERLPLDYAIPKKPNPKRRLAGWLALVIVAAPVFVLALVLSPCVPLYTSRAEEARQATAKADIVVLFDQLDRFAEDTGRYPTTAEGLGALLNAPPGLANWKGPYVKRLPNDPWGRSYVYHQGGRSGGGGYRVLSVGPDGKEGTADDIAASSSTPATQQAVIPPGP